MYFTVTRNWASKRQTETAHSYGYDTGPVSAVALTHWEQWVERNVALYIQTRIDFEHLNSRRCCCGNAVENNTLSFILQHGRETGESKIGTQADGILLKVCALAYRCRLFILSQTKKSIVLDAFLSVFRRSAVSPIWFPCRVQRRRGPP